MSAQQHVVVGLSGGVDSSVSAWLLKERGFKVTALFMKNWDEDDDQENCTVVEDLADCEAVCETLGIPLKTISFSTEYWDRVFASFLSDLKLGRTPNPDILCNTEIKFKEFFLWAKELGADVIATGHYARIQTFIQNGSPQFRLLRGIDTNKDQTYFLHAIDRDVLPFVKFPIGGMQKSKVRELAAELGLTTQTKKDSTGICFIGERRFRDFLSRYLPLKPGRIETLDSSHVGEHHGLASYTIGQRQGLGIGGPGEPWYVAGKDLQRNTLIAVQGHDHPALFAQTLRSEPAHWLRLPQDETFKCTAKTRYRQADDDCTVSLLESGTVNVTFDRPQRAMTPGQSVVFYQGDECLGGAVIADVLTSHHLRTHHANASSTEASTTV